jgi:mRNA-degrading endonuclease RelE of RelBE toxin-antitoxin system
MVDKITKALNKFTQKEKELVKNLLLKINKNNVAGLDLKKLKGRNDVYRVRKGKIRIIYRIEDKQIFLLAIERRNENTYKDI